MCSVWIQSIFFQIHKIKSLFVIAYTSATLTRTNNFHQLEAVSRYRDPQLQVGGNYWCRYYDFGIISSDLFVITAIAQIIMTKSLHVIVPVKYWALLPDQVPVFVLYSAMFC